MGYWWIDDKHEEEGDATYYHDSDAETPPLEDWKYNNTFGPAPVLSVQSCGPIPTLNELGLAILAVFMAGSAIWIIRRRGKCT